MTNIQPPIIYLFNLAKHPQKDSSNKKDYPTET